MYVKQAFSTINKGMLQIGVGLTIAILASIQLASALAEPPIAATDVIGQLDFTSSDSGTTATELDGPTGVVVDYTNRRLFVADSGNNRVLVYNLDSNNKLIDKTADFVIGQPDFTSSGSDTTQTTLDMDDGGLVFDELNNRLFVSDESNCRIMVYDTTTITNGMAASNVLGQPDFTSSSCETDINSFDYNESTPSYDPARQLLFVPEYSNNRVLIFDVNTITDGEDAVYVLGQPDFTSSSDDDGPSGLYLEYVGSVYDPTTKRLYLSDQDNERVVVYDTTTLSNGMAASYVLGQPDFETTDSDTDQNSFDQPEALAIDTANQVLYVYDEGNDRVLMFDVLDIDNGEDAINVIGQPDFTSSISGTSATEINPNDVTGMFYDEVSETLYLPEDSNNRVLLFTDLYDGDDIDSSIEDGGPNKGDANGDGIRDSLQDDVTSIPNDKSEADGDYITIETSGCTSITAFDVDSENELSAVDEFDFPLGMADFTVSCASAGDSMDVVIYFEGEYDTSDWIAKKYINGAYSDISGATFGTATVGASTVTTMSYSVTDGGPLDADGVANGVIIDPAGPAVTVTLDATAPNTGLGSVNITWNYLYVVLGLVIIGAGSRIYSRDSK